MKLNFKTIRVFLVCSALAFLVLSAVCFIPGCSAVSSTEAQGALDRAESDLGLAFVEVAEAERGGVDVSLFLIGLESASVSLSEAYFAFSAGDYEKAILLASKCSEAVVKYYADDSPVKMEAEQARSDRLFWASFFSLFGVISVVLFGIIGWRFLKRHYFRGILDMKPELEDVT